VPKVRLCIEVSDEFYRAYESEARRRRSTVENLVEQTVTGLLAELKQEENSGTDHPIIPS